VGSAGRSAPGPAGRSAVGPSAPADSAPADSAPADSAPADSALADSALAWYAEAARDLPWRRPDVGPWAVLVSEVMLQQTPVSRVLPVYSAWLRRWPTPRALAANLPGEAVRAWGRLGYPRRALRLHAAAAVIDREHAGHVPDDLDALRALPGVGAYTAAAVASFAFRRRQPVLDTNVARLLTRLFADGTRASDGLLRQRLDRMLPTEPAVAAAASVAFMELGALVCTARSPACGRCPLCSQCRLHGSRGFGSEGSSRPPNRASRPSGQPGLGAAPRRPPYRGSVREARGLVLAALRSSPGPVAAGTLSLACPDATRRASALAGLLADGLLQALPDGTYALP